MEPCAVSILEDSLCLHVCFTKELLVFQSYKFGVQTVITMMDQSYGKAARLPNVYALWPQNAGLPICKASYTRILFRTASGATIHSTSIERQKS